MEALRKVVPQWRKQGCQLLKNKNSGQVDIVVGMMLFLILLLAILFSFRISQYMVTAANVEDALAASNLASAVIDLEEYGKSHTIWIPDVEVAFGIFREALCYNLELDEYLNSSNRDIFASAVQIKEYIIYNVQGNDVDICVMDGEGRVLIHQSDVIGRVFTPDNVFVETTTVYSRVGFFVEGLMGQVFYAEKEKSIDIARYDGE